MDIKKSIKEGIVTLGLRIAGDKDIFIEANKRSGADPLSGYVKKAPTPTKAIELRDWKTALASAESPDNPNNVLLLNVYDSLLLDLHLCSVIESRILRVVRSKYKLVNENGEENDEIKRLINKKWFEDFLRYAMWSMFRGPQLLEILEKDEEGFIKWVKRVPERHVKTKKGIVVKEQNDDSGTSYRDGIYANYYLQVGNDDELGLLSNLAPMVIFKKNAFSIWTELQEKLGVPPRYVQTNTNDKTRITQLSEMMENLISSSWAVINADEKIEILSGSTSTNPQEMFNSMISVINSEISKRILGQDGTTDNKDASGTYGSLKVLEGVANDRHESDKVAMKSIINNYLFPLLINQGGPYLALANHSLEWDDFNEMGQQQLIDAVSKLASHYHIDVDILAKKTGIPILGEKQQQMQQAPQDDDSGEKKK